MTATPRAGVTALLTELPGRAPPKIERLHPRSLTREDFCGQVGLQTSSSGRDGMIPFIKQAPERLFYKWRLGVFSV
jgi:hypothetical protein